MKKREVSILTIVISIVAIGAIVSSVVLYMQNQDIKKDPLYVKLKEAEKTDTLRKKVAALISLPEDEKAFVGDYDSKSALSKNPFFANAKTGDKYLIFSESGKAIIYRESENKLINVGPIAITPDDNKKEPQKTTTDNKK